MRLFRRRPPPSRSRLGRPAAPLAGRPAATLRGLGRGLANSGEGPFARRINRTAHPLLEHGVPYASIVIAAMVGYSPLIASAPVIPPLSYMLLLAWRVLRPGLLPVWAGLPLGAIDDLFSGQPFGSAILLWSATMLAMDMIDQRFLWRTFLADWLATSLLLVAYIALSALFAGFASGHFSALTLVPQLVTGVALFPAVAALVMLLDALRLLRVRVLRQ